MPQDKSLQMNQTIETAILQLQQSPTPEQLAHTLTVVRRCMQAGGQWIVAVEPVPGGGQVQPRANAAKPVLTIRSSREWKVITASRPPRFSRGTADWTIRSTLASSSLTAMRMA